MIADPLLQIFNCFLQIGVVHKLLKAAKVILFRPINMGLKLMFQITDQYTSIFFSKILHKIMYTRFYLGYKLYLKIKHPTYPSTR